MCVKPVALLSASLLLVVVLLATQAAAAAPLPRKLLRLQGAADPEQQIAAMAQFRKAETALLKKVSSGDAGECLKSTKHMSAQQHCAAQQCWQQQGKQVDVRCRCSLS
jgi:Tfp pilus assembly protein FimT